MADLQIGLLVENSSRQVLYANPVLCQLLRITVSPEDLIGDNYSSLVERSGPFLVDVSAFIHRTEGLRHAQQQAQRDLLPFSDGRILEFEYHPVSITEEYQGHLWIFRDVTERERTQHAFLHNQRFIDSLLEILPDVIYIFDLSQRQNVYVSPRIIPNLGYTPEEIQAMGGDMLPRVIHPDDLPALTGHHANFLNAGGNPGEIEYRAAHRDGTWRWIRAYDTVLRRDREGKPDQLLGIARDITDRKELEAARDSAIAALQEAERRLAHAQSVAHVGSWEYDVSSEKVTWSLETFRLFEFDPDDGAPSYAALIGRFHEEDRARLEEGMQNALKRGIAYALDLRLLKRDGISTRWVHMVGRPNTEPGRMEPVTRLSGVVQDIDERHQLEGQLRHTDKMQALGQFAAEITHEINNPIAAISGVAQLLERHPEPQVAEDGQTIREMADRAGHIVRSLRKFVQDGSAFPATSHYPFIDLNTTVKTSLSLVKRQRGLAASDLKLQFADGLPLVAADAGQIEQIIVNLVTNARQAMSALPRNERLLTIHTEFSEEGSRRLLIRVSDSGPGIADENRDRIFAPFFTTKPRSKGMGLGLSICRSIARAHGGDISVESAEGTGSTFTLWLPVPPSLYDRSGLL